MAWVTPAQVSVGEIPTHTTWNQNAVANLKAIYGAPAARIYRNSDQSISSGGYNAIQFSHTSYANGITVDLDFFNTRLTIATAGIYLISAKVQIANYVSAGYKEVQLWKNGSGNIIGEYYTYSQLKEWIHISSLVELAVNDYIEVAADRNSITITVSLDGETESAYLSAHWIAGN